MTEVEEAAFRVAAREALGRTDVIVLVAAENPSDVPAFSLATFDNSRAIGIIVPESWMNEDGAEDRCQAILRQESKALAGQGLD